MPNAPLPKDEEETRREQLYQAQKLEAIGRLAGGIAHDFNNILAAMNGYAEFLIEDLDEASPQHEFAINILKSGAQARDLVDKILVFSRREDTQMQTIDLKEAMEQSFLILKSSLPKTIDLFVDIDEIPAFINGNKSQIAETIMNLCVNAKDAMPDKRGKLQISIKPMGEKGKQNLKTQEELPSSDILPLVKLEEIDAGKGGAAQKTRLVMGALAKGHEYVSLRVADTGSGMSREVMEKIFEPFFTTKSVDKGTGLGLAMTHGMIAAHHGAMIIESEVGRGTIFELFFPLAQQEAQDTQDTQDTQDAPKVKSTSACDAKILLVDDQHVVRVMMMKMLERLGLEAEACETGVEALTVLRENPGYFDIVLTDQNMPEMNGIEMIRKATPEFPDLDFIILSGYSEEKLKVVMAETPAIKAVLRKPVAKDVLFQTIKDVCAGEPQA